MSRPAQPSVTQTRTCRAIFCGQRRQAPPPPLQPTTPSKQLGTRYLRRGAPRPAQPDIAGGPAQKGPVDSNWPFNVIGDAAVWHLWLLQVYGKHMAGAVRWSLWRRASFGL